MSVILAKQDTATIRKALGWLGGRPYSEKRSYGRRIKFWWTESPGDMAEISAKLKVAFGDRFIRCGMINGMFSPNDFEVQLKNWK